MAVPLVVPKFMVGAVRKILPVLCTALISDELVPEIVTPFEAVSNPPKLPVPSTISRPLVVSLPLASKVVPVEP